MSHVVSKERRVLAIDPSPRGFGFAVLEGPNRLIDWGVKEVYGADKNTRCLRRITELLELYGPDVIVVEDYQGDGSRRCVRIEKLISGICELAAEKRIQTRSISRSAVRKAFSQLGAQTKYQIATIIAERFPELAPRLPPFRKCWMSEDARMSIFDALAFALAFFNVGGKRRWVG